MNQELARAVRAAGLTLSGSLLAVEKGHRIAAAEELWEHGAWAHADVIDGSYGNRPSLTLEEIRALREAGGPLDVHLMVDDVVGWISVLPAGLDRVTIQADRQGDIPKLIALARSRAAEVWLATDTVESPEVPEAGADGILFLLVPPAAPGYALDLGRLQALADKPVHPRTGVDGGVTEEHVDQLAAAGASYAVVGRALYSPAATSGQEGRP